MAYKFQFITDERFKGTRAKLVSMDRRLKSALKNMDGVSLRVVEPLYVLNWTRKETGGFPHKQWRVTYIVSKNTRQFSWNDVFGRINKIYAPSYKKW